MSVKRLEVIEFTVLGSQDDPEALVSLDFKPGYKYTYFVDPVTNRYYRPKESFYVEGEDLEELFEEVD